MSFKLFTQKIQCFGDQLVHVDRLRLLIDIREKSTKVRKYLIGAHAGSDHPLNASACLTQTRRRAIKITLGGSAAHSNSGKRLLHFVRDCCDHSFDVCKLIAAFTLKHHGHAHEPRIERKCLCEHQYHHDRWDENREYATRIPSKSEATRNEHCVDHELRYKCA